MQDYKSDAARAAMEFIRPNQKIGFGAGSTILKLIDLIREDAALAKSLTFVSSSFKTTEYIETALKTQLTSDQDELAIYFDGCDQFDMELNALKSGGGIHTSEKILAASAKQFILVGDDGKYVEKLDTTYPLVLEILPEAVALVQQKIQFHYPESLLIFRMSMQKDVAVITENGNFLADLQINSMPELAKLNSNIKMIPGVVDHSLFYRWQPKPSSQGEKGLVCWNQNSKTYYKNICTTRSKPAYCHLALPEPSSMLLFWIRIPASTWSLLWSDLAKGT